MKGTTAQKEIIKVTETVYGFSHYYTLHFSDGSWEHQFYIYGELESFLNKETSPEEKSPPTI